MTNKDFIKLLLISVGCDKKYEIDSHRTDDGSTYYYVTGEGYNENQSICFDGFSMYDLVLSFLNNIKEDPDIDLLNKLNYSVNHLSQKSLLDDDVRNSIYEQQKKDRRHRRQQCRLRRRQQDCGLPARDRSRSHRPQRGQGVGRGCRFQPCDELRL